MLYNTAESLPSRSRARPPRPKQSSCARAGPAPRLRGIRRAPLPGLTVVPDQFRHEIATAFNLRGRGLVLLTSCSHRGVVNDIRQAQAASGIEKVHVLIGGLHLAPYQDDYVQQTVQRCRRRHPRLMAYRRALFGTKAKLERAAKQQSAS